MSSRGQSRRNLLGGCAVYHRAANPDEIMHASVDRDLQDAARFDALNALNVYRAYIGRPRRNGLNRSRPAWTGRTHAVSSDGGQLDGKLWTVPAVKGLQDDGRWCHYRRR